MKYKSEEKKKKNHHSTRAENRPAAAHSEANCLFKTCIAQNIPDGVRVYILTQTLFTYRERERVHIDMKPTIYFFILLCHPQSMPELLPLPLMLVLVVVVMILLLCHIHFDSVSLLFMIVSSWKFSRTWCFVVDFVFLFGLAWLGCYFFLCIYLSLYLPTIVVLILIR